MRIAILTSSRADYGIYLPLIKKMEEDSFFDLSIIAFGTHLSPFHGETIKQIQNDGFVVKYKVESMLLTDSSEAIATAVGLTMIKFADFWKKYKSEFDLVFCLGDRYEMFAAVIAGIPFNIPFAHLHGGETTLGAIDNIFRHSISLASKLHFVSTPMYVKRLSEILGAKDGIHYVGALSLDNLENIKLLTLEEFQTIWGVDLTKKTILVTFHPETIATDKNESYVNELIDAFEHLPNYQFLITMPNADTEGNAIRKSLINYAIKNPNVFLVENLGTQSYFTAISLCCFLLGNTSSGIIEAASFGKYVINLGDRQKGRISSNNVYDCEFNSMKILNLVSKVNKLPAWNPRDNIYFKGGAAEGIIEVLRKLN